MHNIIARQLIALRWAILAIYECYWGTFKLRSLISQSLTTFFAAFFTFEIFGPSRLRSIIFSRSFLAVIWLWSLIIDQMHTQKKTLGCAVMVNKIPYLK